MGEQTRIRMSAEEFEALPEQEVPVELIEGELLVKGLPKIVQQRVALKLATMLQRSVPNGEVFIAPVSVKLDDANYYQPDVLWVAADSACEVADDGVIGAPDLVVEVLSPGTAQYDRGIKFQQYQQHGVREYWIVEPGLAFLEVWVLSNGLFAQQGVYGADAAFNSPIMNTEIKLVSLF
jgi:Uma2 family endonuclease